MYKNIKQEYLSELRLVMLEERKELEKVAALVETLLAMHVSLKVCLGMSRKVVENATCCHNLTNR